MSKGHSRLSVLAITTHKSADHTQDWAQWVACTYGDVDPDSTPQHPRLRMIYATDRARQKEVMGKAGT